MRTKAQVDRLIAKNISGYLWTQARQRAKKSGLPFSITKSDVKVPQYCPMLGIPLRRGGRKNNSNAPSLDRINNDLGYIKGNVWVVSRKANTIKSNASILEIIEMAERLKMVDFSKITGSVIIPESEDRQDDLVFSGFDKPSNEKVDYSSPVESWTLRDYRTGKIHKLVLFPSRRRVNAFRVVVNGTEWSRAIGCDRLLRQTRKALNRL